MSSLMLEQELKEIIITTLDLEDMSPDKINSSEPLFGEGLGLDSIDALELGLAIQKKYGVKLSASSDENKIHFASVANLVKFIESGISK